MTPPSPDPAWTTTAGHPLGLPLPYKLCLQAGCHRPPLWRSPGSTRDGRDPGQQALCLGPHHASAHQVTRLSNQATQLLLHLLLPSYCLCLHCWYKKIPNTSTSTGIWLPHTDWLDTISGNRAAISRSLQGGWHIRSLLQTPP